MDDQRKRVTTTPWPEQPAAARPPANPVESLWHRMTEDQKRNSERFTGLEQQVEDVQKGVTAIAGAVAQLTTSEANRAEAEARAAKSVELRNTRMWQIAIPVISGLAIAVIIALFKVLVPLAMGHQVQVNPTVNEMVDEGRFDPTRRQHGGAL